MFIKDAGFLRLVGLLLLPGRRARGTRSRIVRRAWAASRNLTTLVTDAAWSSGSPATYLRVPKTPFVGNYIARDGVLSDRRAGGQPAGRDPELAVRPARRRSARSPGS